jgi:TPR repeat protein
MQAAIQRHDYAAAMRILRPLASQGDAEAAYMIGTMYEFGHGFQLDFVSEFLWYRYAAAHGIDVAEVFLDNVFSKLTDSEKAQAEKLEPEWTPTTHSLNTTIAPETWVCERGDEKTYKQEWDIANGRATAPREKDFAY